MSLGLPFYKVYQYNIGNINDLTDIYICLLLSHCVLVKENPNGSYCRVIKK